MGFRWDSQQIKNDCIETDIAKMRTCDGSVTITWTVLSIDKVVHHGLIFGLSVIVVAPAAADT